MAPQQSPKERNAPANDARTSALEPLQSLGGAAGVLTGLAFINGWLYWATYYTAFGLNSLVLDLPFAVISVSPVQILVRDWKTETNLMQCVLVLAVTAAMVLSGLFVHWYKHGHANATLLLIVLVVGMSAGAWRLGLHDYELDAGCQSRLPTITFELIEQIHAGDVPPPCLANSGQTCMLIIHANSAYRYFVAPESPYCDYGGQVGSGHLTYEIPDNQLRIANIQTHIGW